ncbi:MAG: hypothetical protein JNJ83_10030 [Verrucomicrobiaceae bacterium]|nr:hypothetical protein [Verrucomicrobiaceae bacterium]
MKRFSGWFLFVVALVAAFAWAYKTQPSFREVVVGGFGLLASVFTSPFILEATLAVIGLVIVMTYNQRKLDKEGKDEWVEMNVETPGEAEGATAEKKKNG